jgi:hypothetical protein
MIDLALITLPYLALPLYGIGFIVFAITYHLISPKFNTWYAELLACILIGLTWPIVAIFNSDKLLSRR